MYSHNSHLQKQSHAPTSHSARWEIFRVSYTNAPRARSRHDTATEIIFCCTSFSLCVRSSQIMSFGFAVGDFIAAGKLIRDIVSILRTAARAEYQELILELHGLQQALNHVEQLRVPPERQIAITSVKAAALTCTFVLDEFAKKLKRFEDLSVQVRASKATLWAQKLRWGFTMDDEVRKLRTYLLSHVGYLNMRLATEGLYVSCSKMNQNKQRRHAHVFADLQLILPYSQSRMRRLR